MKVEPTGLDWLKVGYKRKKKKKQTRTTSCVLVPVSGRAMFYEQFGYG